MRTPRRSFSAAAAVVISCWSAAPVRAQSTEAPPAALGCADIETFLKTAKIGRPRDIPVGVTIPQRATLDGGSLRHDAAIQTADVRQATYTTPRGTELNFRDTWKFNVAGYELAKMVQLNMVPPYVERRHGGGPASLSWWVNDTMMERDCVQKKMTPPDTRRWNDEMQGARLFARADWRLRIQPDEHADHEGLAHLDHRLLPGVWSREDAAQYPEEVARVDRTLLGRLRALNRDEMRKNLGKWLSNDEIDAVLARRDVLVGMLDKHVAAKGEAAVPLRPAAGHRSVRDRARALIRFGRLAARTAASRPDYYSQFPTRFRRAIPAVDAATFERPRRRISPTAYEVDRRVGLSRHRPPPATTSRGDSVGIEVAIALAFTFICHPVAAWAQSGSSGAPSPPEKVVLSYFHDVLDGRKTGLLEGLFLPDCVIYRPEGTVKGMAGIRGVVERNVAAYSHFATEVHDIFESGDRVVVRVTHRATGAGVFGSENRGSRRDGQTGHVGRDCDFPYPGWEDCRGVGQPRLSFKIF